VWFWVGLEASFIQVQLALPCTRYVVEDRLVRGVEAVCHSLSYFRLGDGDES